VLKQRELVVAAGSPSAAPQPSASRQTNDAELLVEIRDALLRIEQRLPDA